MSKVRLKIRVVFYKDTDGDIVAHCLEMDLCGHGNNRRDALEMLTSAIAMQIEASIEADNVGNIFSPADSEFFRMFAEGRDYAVGDLEISFKAVSDGVEFEGWEAREYCGEDLALA